MTPQPNFAMPLFSKNGDRDDPRPDEAEQAPADEHTRLLPNRVDSNQGLLTPDDPAVSPYNLWTVRILRYLTFLFAAVSFAWWTLLLVSAFATPPGAHIRGSGFLAFGYASLALANTLFTLVFFGVPSKAVRILAIILAVSSELQPRHTAHLY